MRDIHAQIAGFLRVQLTAPRAEATPTARTNQTADALVTALRSVGKPTTNPKCIRGLCFVEVDYASPDDFSRVDEVLIKKGSSPFRTWPRPKGRTALLATRENRLFAMWYFFDEEYRSIRRPGTAGVRPVPGGQVAPRGQEGPR